MSKREMFTRVDSQSLLSPKSSDWAFDMVSWARAVMISKIDCSSNSRLEVNRESSDSRRIVIST